MTTPYVYDADDRLLSAGATVFAHDALGRLTQETTAGQVTTYGYDAAGRLTVKTSPMGTSTFGYDADGVLISEQSGGVTRTYLVDVERPFSQVLEERTGGAVTARSIWGNGDQLLARIDSGAPALPLQDAQRNVRLFTGGSGAVTGALDLDAFGRVQAESGSFQSPYGLAGERRTADGALYQLRARMYSPEHGRFLTRDPLLSETPLPGGGRVPLRLQPYGYADADPINHRDPSGRATLGELMAGNEGTANAAIGWVRSINPRLAQMVVKTNDLIKKFDRFLPENPITFGENNPTSIEELKKEALDWAKAPIPKRFDIALGIGEVKYRGYYDNNALLNFAAYVNAFPYGLWSGLGMGFLGSPHEATKGVVLVAVCYVSKRIRFNLDGVAELLMHEAVTDTLGLNIGPGDDGNGAHNDKFFTIAEYAIVDGFKQLRNKTGWYLRATKAPPAWNRVHFKKQMK